MSNIPCPICRQALSVGQALPLNLRCPRCQTRFRALADGSTSVTGQPALPLAPRAPLPTQLLQAAPPISPKPGIGSRLVLLGIVGAAVCLFLALGGGILAYCLYTPENPTESAEETMPLPKKSGKAGGSGLESANPVPLQPVALTKQGPAKGQGIGAVLPGGPEPATAAGKIKDVNSAPQPAPAANQKEIDAAIPRATAWLYSRAGGGQVGGNFGDRVGAAAFVGLTLLSCGVPADDPIIAAIANRIRTQTRAEVRTYDLSCCVWFLDKLGNPGDAALIRSMAMRLMAGQTESGAWNYNCVALTAEQEKQLLAALAMPGKDADGASPFPFLRYTPGQKLEGSPGDNSNTQFAVLALWAAQKHGVPVARSLAMAEARFRFFQLPNGSWSYTTATPPVATDSMACAGIVTLAVGQGNRAGELRKDKAEPGVPVRDEQIDRALSFLGKRLKAWDEKAKSIKEPYILEMIGADAIGELYLLWSIERVGVLCDLDTIGGQNWYEWGSKVLLNSQKPDGRWEVHHGSTIDTCFALLFLRRVNVAHDLTKVLNDLGGVRDPGGKAKAPIKGGGELTAGNKVIPSIQPGLSKVRSGYALPTGQPPGARTRRRRGLRKRSPLCDGLARDIEW